jgi:hypothetical protein
MAVPAVVRHNHDTRTSPTHARKMEIHDIFTNRKSFTSKRAGTLTAQNGPARTNNAT